MKKETIKEIGKYFLDISKIFIALAIVSPFIKMGEVSLFAFIVTLGLLVLGLYYTNKGVKDE
jgi:hypothetical protein